MRFRLTLFIMVIFVVSLITLPSYPQKEGRQVPKDNRQISETDIKGRPVYVKGDLIVAFHKNGISPTDKKILTKINKRFHPTKVDQFLKKGAKGFAKKNPKLKEKMERRYLITIDANVDINDAIKAWSIPEVEYAQPNFLYYFDAVPTDPRYGEQWAYQVTEAEAGWDLETGSSNAIVAVIDTGFDLNHEDLAERYWTNSEIIDGVDTDENGYESDIRGWDFVGNDNDPSPPTAAELRSITCPATNVNRYAAVHHGTLVAGIIGAIPNNGRGIGGLMWGVSILPLRVGISLQGCDATTSQISGALYYAIEKGAGVVNMSFGSYAFPDRTVLDAISDGSGETVYVAAAGNDGLPWAAFPASLEEVDVISVAATDSGDRRADFGRGGSNYGAFIDVSAPGKDMLTTDVGNTYSSESGTSLSSPFVAGLAGLIRSKFPDMSVNDVRDRIFYTVDRIRTDHMLGTGRVNVRRALDPEVRTRPFVSIIDPDGGDRFLEREDIELWGCLRSETYQVRYRAAAAAEWTVTGNGTGDKIFDTIGMIPSSGLPPGGYVLEVVASEGGRSVSQQIEFSVPDYLAGWPISIPPYSRNLNFADLDYDGRKEIIFAEGSRLHVHNSNGEVRPGWPVELESAIYTYPVVDDLRRDGNQKIVVGRIGYIHILNPDGTEERRWTLPSSNSFPKDPALIDWDGDGDLEIVLVINNNGRFQISIFQHNGELLRTVANETRHLRASGGPVVADFNADGTYDIGIVSEEDTGMESWRGGGFMMIYRTHIYLNTAPDPTVIERVGLEAENIPPLPLAAKASGAASPVFIHSLDARSVQFENIASMESNVWDLGPLGLLPSPLSMAGVISAADLDANGDIEAIVGLDDGRMVVLKEEMGSAVVAEGWPQNTTGNLTSPPLIVDLDQDGDYEIIAATNRGYIYTFNHDGTSFRSPIIIDRTTTKTPIIGDIDGDGYIDLCALYSNDEGGQLYCWHLRQLFDPSRIIWDRVNGNHLSTRAPTPPLPTIPTPALPRCGDGTVDTGEECDDGNLIIGDGCDAACVMEREGAPPRPICGNGIAEMGEECDDGNASSIDGCTRDCRICIPPDSTAPAKMSACCPGLVMEEGICRRRIISGETLREIARKMRPYLCRMIPRLCSNPR